MFRALTSWRTPSSHLNLGFPICCSLFAYK
jgi:hypothetical protein